MIENPNEPPDDVLKELMDKANRMYAEFRSEELTPDEKIKYEPPTMAEKAKAFLSSMASRGFTNKTAPTETIELRQLSCHGNDVIPPCSERKNSDKFPDSFYCGSCGCGDKTGTQLVSITIKEKPQYSKLDYPKVSCPLKMPGFTDYVPTEVGVSENSRKIEIEVLKGLEYTAEYSNSKPKKLK